MTGIPHNGASLAAQPAAAPARVAVPGDLTARLADLVTMARDWPRTTVTADEIELIRRNIETLELLFGVGGVQSAAADRGVHAAPQ
jgi:hypothetical protein